MVEKLLIGDLILIEEFISGLQEKFNFYTKWLN